jgi:ABC-type phosphate/phosphonate transport system substrate-binding protein
MKVTGSSFLVVSLVSVLALAGCGSSHTSGSGGSSGQKTAATKLAFTSAGVPNLSGWNIPIATAGSHPGVEDTLGYIVEKTLQSWGANSSLNLGESPEGADAVVAGRIDAINSDMPSLLNLPLEIFMPNQVKMDYVFVSTKATSLSDLRGKSVDVGTKTSIQSFLMPALLKAAGLTQKDVKITLSGSSSGSAIGTVLAEGRADAAWVHISALHSLQAKISNLHVLAHAGTVLPDIADSFWAATPGWLSAHPAIAEALCLAWIHASKVFNDNASQWVTMAENYTNNADPVSRVQADHSTFSSLNLWPLAKSDYSPSVVADNYHFWQSFNEFSGAGNRPLNKVAIYGPWNAAWAVYNKNPSAY